MEYSPRTDDPRLTRRNGVVDVATAPTRRLQGAFARIIQAPAGTIGLFEPWRALRPSAKAGLFHQAIILYGA